MLCVRFICLVAAIYFVDAKSLVTSDDDLTIDDFEDLFFDNLGEQVVSELRKRRDVDDEPTSPNQASEPSSTSIESGECPPCPHPHHRGPPHPCAGLSGAACRQKMAPPPYNGPPCELRPLFRMPMDFNHTARRECFDRWEKPALIAKGVDFSKPRRARMGLRQMGQRSLMIHKGCDVQCMFLESSLLTEDGDNFKVSKEAVIALLKEEDDPQELTDVFEEQINKCIEESADLVHPKQSCKSGADEFLDCVRFNVDLSCAGAKWKESKSCVESEDAVEKMRNCRREQRSKFMSQIFGQQKRFRHADN